MMKKISMLAIDLAKGSFQVCAVGANGAVVYNRVLSRTRLAALPSALRTAATSAAAARALAPKGGRTQAIIGNGAQAAFQALAILSNRPLVKACMTTCAQLYIRLCGMGGRHDRDQGAPGGQLRRHDPDHGNAGDA
jgi:hypothetical protein